MNKGQKGGLGDLIDKTPQKLLKITIYYKDVILELEVHEHFTVHQLIATAIQKLQEIPQLRDIPANPDKYKLYQAKKNGQPKTDYPCKLLILAFDNDLLIQELHFLKFSLTIKLTVGKEEKNISQPTPNPSQPLLNNQQKKSCWETIKQLCK